MYALLRLAAVVCVPWSGTDGAARLEIRIDADHAVASAAAGAIDLGLRAAAGVDRAHAPEAPGFRDPCKARFHQDGALRDAG